MELFAEMLADYGECSTSMHTHYLRGMMYTHGYGGVLPDDYEACKSMKFAAENGHHSAESYYGAFLRIGKGCKKDPVKAAKYLKRSAEGGDAAGQCNYACILGDGDGIPMNLVESAKWYKRAADQEHHEGLLRYGLCLIEGKGVAQNAELGCSYLRRAIEQDSLEAYNAYGLCLLNGTGVEKNHESALNYFQMGAEKGDDDALKNYQKFSVTLSVKEQVLSLEDLKKEADSGEAQSQYEYGCAIFESKTADKDAAAHYLQLAADQGHADAQERYAKYWLENHDVVRARHYFKLSADQDNPSAQYNYACLVEMLDQDYETGLCYYRKAAFHNHAEAQAACGIHAMEGKGMEVNNSIAAYYCKLAADQDSLEGIAHYGLCLQTGTGVDQNWSEALKYFKRAADKGHSDATLNYGALLIQKAIKKDGIIPSLATVREAKKYMERARSMGNSRAKEHLRYVTMCEQLHSNRNAASTAKIKAALSLAFGT